MIPDQLECTVNDEEDFEGQVSLRVDNLVDPIPVQLTVLEHDCDGHEAELAEDWVQLLQLCQWLEHCLERALLLAAELIDHLGRQLLRRFLID